MWSLEFWHTGFVVSHIHINVPYAIAMQLQHSLEDIDQCDEKEWFQRFGDDGVPVGSTCP